MGEQDRNGVRNVTAERDCWELKAFRDVTFNKQVLEVVQLNATKRNFMEICRAEKVKRKSSFLAY